jgi:hypothetical protein
MKDMFSILITKYLSGNIKSILVMEISELEIMSYFDNRVTIPVIGDSSKTIIMSMWGEITEIPGAWSKKITIENNGDKEDCIVLLWDVMMGSMIHMFPSDSVDHSILIYDMSLRRSDMRSRKYDIHDYLKHIVDMKGQYSETTCIIIKDDSNSNPSASPSPGEIIRACKGKRIKNIYTLSNTGQDISSLKTLVSDVSTRIYNTRRASVNTNIREYIEKMTKA